MDRIVALNNYNYNVLDKNEKITILITSLSLGGAEKIIKDWALSEAKRGRKVEIAILCRKEFEHIIKHENIKIIQKRENESTKDFLYKLNKYWDSLIVSTHLLNNDVYNYIWSLGMKTVPVIHNDQRGWKNEATFFNNNNVLQVVSCSDYVKKELEENGLKKHIVVVKHLPLIDSVVSDEHLRQQLRNSCLIKNDDVLIGLIGAIKEQKNYKKIVDIAKLLPNKYKFLIFGDSFNAINEKIKQELVSLIKENKLENRIRLIGFKKKINKYMTMLDGVLNCSLYEGFSIATQEALLAGLPVISSNVSGQSEITLDNLKLVDVNDTDQFVKEIKKLKTRKVITTQKRENISRLWTLTTAIEKEPLIEKLKIRRKERVLFLTANLNSGGAQRSLVNLTTQLNIDLEIAICNKSTNDYFSKKLEEKNILFYRLSKSRDVYDLTNVLLKRIHQKGIKTICMWNVDPKMKLLLALYLKKTVKFIDVSPGAYAFEEMNAVKDFQVATSINETKFYNRLDELVLKFNADLGFLGEHEVKTTVIKNGVEDLSIKKETNVHSKKILISGRIADSKYPIEIIKAFNLFNKEKNNEFTLHFYGQVEEKNKNLLEKLIILTKNNDKIVFHGSDSDLSFMQKHFYMTIILGIHQGCPNAVLESASGLIPVISNNSGGTKEIIKHNNSGFLLAEHFTIKELVSAMLEMTEQKRLLFINEAKKIVNNEFSIKQMVSSYRKIL